MDLLAQTRELLLLLQEPDQRLDQHAWCCGLAALTHGRTLRSGAGLPRRQRCVLTSTRAWLEPHVLEEPAGRCAEPRGSLRAVLSRVGGPSSSAARRS